MQNKNIESFLKTGTTYYPTLWDDQIGYFLLMLVFIAPQIIKTPLLPIVSFIIEIVLLAYCRKAEEKRYGNVYCYFIHMLILLLALWVDGWIVVSYIWKIQNIHEIMILGTCTYVICVYVRVVIVQYKISHGFYAKTPKKTYAKEISVSVAIATVIVLRGIKIRMKQEYALKILAGCCFLLAFLLLKITDLGMMCFYFHRLTPEEQENICGTRIYYRNCR